MVPLSTDVISLEMKYELRLERCADFTEKWKGEDILGKQTLTAMKRPNKRWVLWVKKKLALEKEDYIDKKGADSPKTSLSQIMEELYHLS